MIRATILAAGIGLIAGGFIDKAISNSNATMLQAAQIGVVSQ
jgi:hypothetical protein